MCDRDDCYLCRWLDSLEVRDVTWCSACDKREAVEGADLCVMCNVSEPRHQ